MGAESIAQVDDSPVTQIRKPDKVETLDVALLDMPMKENLDFVNSIDSPDSVLSASLKENSGGVSNESVTVNNVNGIDNVDPGFSTSAITPVDKDADAKGKLIASETTGVATREALTLAAEVEEGTGEQDSGIKKDDALEASILIVQTSTANASIVHEIQEMEEISLEEDGEQKGSFKKAVSAPESQPVMNDSKKVESNNKKSTPGLGDTLRSVSQPSTSAFDAVEPGSSKQQGQVADSKPSTAKLVVAERNIKQDALVTTEAISQPVISENPGAELKIKTEVAKAVERTEREEKLAVLAASAIESLPTSKYARASEIQEAAEPATPPTPERTGTVIRLTRQMSRVSTGMGPMSPRFEIRAAKEIQDLQEKVKLMEEELRRKSAVIETLSFNHKERESGLLNKIECLELANEQLLQGGNDSSIQLQMELTRLQRQNSVLQLRERELQFQITTQEMIKTQMLDKRPATAEPTNPVEQLESKVAVLESKLAEAVEVSNMYKIQLHEAFSRQKSAQSAALLNLGDAGEVLKELQKLRKQTKEQDSELVDLQDRYFMISVRLAETAAQKEELLSKLKRIQGIRRDELTSVRSLHDGLPISEATGIRDATKVHGSSCELTQDSNLRIYLKPL